MKLPDETHPITIKPAEGRWRVLFEGRVIADSGEALILKEASYPAVVYFPRQDVVMDTLARTQHATHCPYKGDASYFSLRADGHMAENAVWTYETPFPAMEEITGRLAFYPDKVTVEQVPA
jgi:uncharacterized protein (DUF427 family)